jgi:hypothetical protein
VVRREDVDVGADGVADAASEIRSYTSLDSRAAYTGLVVGTATGLSIQEYRHCPYKRSHSDLAIQVQPSVVEGAYLVVVAQDEDANQDAGLINRQASEAPQAHLDHLVGGHQHHSSVAVADRRASQELL